MPAEGVNERGRRLAGAIGDEVNGQVIQNYKPLTTKLAEIKWLAFETLVVSSTAKKLVNNQAGYDYALITVDADSVKFTLDDTVPTASVGHTVVVNGQLILQSVLEVKNVQFIRVTTDSTLQVTYGTRLQ